MPKVSIYLTLDEWIPILLKLGFSYLQLWQDSCEFPYQPSIRSRRARDFVVEVLGEIATSSMFSFSRGFMVFFSSLGFDNVPKAFQIMRCFICLHCGPT